MGTYEYIKVKAKVNINPFAFSSKIIFAENIGPKMRNYLLLLFVVYLAEEILTDEAETQPKVSLTVFTSS